MRNIAIFASGAGTNAENIIKYFSNNKTAGVNLILSNRREAYVLKRAEAHNIRSLIFDRHTFYHTDIIPDSLLENKVDFIVLAGFLWMVPDNILRVYDKRIVNVHPALLPGYGGKGMYGDLVHKAVLASGDKASGITIHYVNSVYDAGDIIFQARCSVDPGDTPETLAAKVHALEYRYFPVVIEDLVKKLPSLF